MSIDQAFQILWPIFCSVAAYIGLHWHTKKQDAKKQSLLESQSQKVDQPKV